MKSLLKNYILRYRLVDVPERVNVFCAMRIILNEIEDVSIVGVEEADVVMAPELDAGVEAPLVLSPLLGRVP